MLRGEIKNYVLDCTAREWLKLLARLIHLTEPAISA